MVLAAGILRAAGRAVIPKLFAGGYSATAALGQLKTLGYGYRRQTFLADWREITGAKKIEAAFRFAPRKYRLSYQMMAPTETFQQQKFKYVFRAHGRDTKTGQLVSRTMSMGNNARLSPDEAEDQYANILGDEAQRYKDDLDFEPDFVELYSVYRKKLPLGAEALTEAEIARWMGE